MLGAFGALTTYTGWKGSNMPGQTLPEEELLQHTGNWEPRPVPEPVCDGGQRLAQDVALIDQRPWPREQQ